LLKLTGGKSKFAQIARW